MATRRDKTKTGATQASVDEFISSVEDDRRRADARALVRIFWEVTGWMPRMWGPTIIGFGAYQYKYESGRCGSMCAAGFSPRKTSLAVYVADFPGRQELLEQLGKHKVGSGQCLYINKLEDVQTTCLKEIISRSLVELRKKWPVTAS
ncbi:MAG: DUF1801 domain-containing protein [Steroidobacteraceae bacterium]